MRDARTQNLQDSFLNQLRKDRVPVTVFLVNGVRLKGIIRGFDAFVIVLKDTQEQLIYKHSVSTIIPEKGVDLRFTDAE